MGREIRRVPPNWEHPKAMNSDQYHPLHDRHYPTEAARWTKDFLEFEEDKKNGAQSDYTYYWEYENHPDEEYCVPYTKEEATWYQVYETVSEGTPVTPPFETQQELIDYLVNHGTFWDKRGFSREVAEKFVLETQWVPSGMFNSATGVFKSGIDCVIP